MKGYAAEITVLKCFDVESLVGDRGVQSGDAGPKLKTRGGTEVTELIAGSCLPRNFQSCLLD